VGEAWVDYDRYHAEGRTARFGDVFERVRVRTISSVMQRSPLPLSQGGTLLDVGAGEGRYLPIWRSLFPKADITAVEVSPIASERSAARYPFARHVVASAEELPFADGSFDAVISIEVIEHVPDGRRMIAECYRVLRPGGWCIISTPCGNRGSLDWWRAKLSGELRPSLDDGIHFGTHDDPTHLRRYRSAEFTQLCELFGFITRRIYFNAHAFMWVGERVEMIVKGKINIGRRSRNLERLFEDSMDTVGMIDWWLLRRVPAASSMIVFLERDHFTTPAHTYNITKPQHRN
jgi:ubiquinone/menaquinone biosynthesis C-methylase UbiE